MSDVRLIDANAMRDDWLENGENEYIYDTNAVLESIDSQPTIDAVPVVHGRWIRVNEEQVYFNVEYVCSECQFVVAVSGVGTPILYGYKYCPNCGAKMDAKDMDVPTKDGGAV